MEALKQYLLPYIISNIVLLASVWAAYKKPIWARIFFAGFFLWASYINSSIAIQSPETYLTYGQLTPVTLYHDFISGFFSRHIRSFILPIAAGQLLICVGLILNKNWTKAACIGGMIFGVAIAPLGVGSAFPSTICMAIAFFILLSKYEHNFIWKSNQYKHSQIANKYIQTKHSV